MTTPMPYMKVSTTAVPASISSFRADWRRPEPREASTSTVTVATAAAPGTMPGMPPTMSPTTMPGKTECTRASTVNSMRRRLTRTLMTAPTIDRHSRKRKALRRYGAKRICSITVAHLAPYRFPLLPRFPWCGPCRRAQTPPSRRCAAPRWGREWRRAGRFLLP